jgi:hypothetical protein
MSAMTNLLVKDDTTGTVVEFTFVPVSDTPNPHWRTNVSGVPLEGQNRLTVSYDKVKSGDYKATCKLEVPTQETLGSSGTAAGYVAPPKTAYVTTGIFTLFYSPRSTVEDRANTVKLLVGLLQGATSTTATGTLDQASAADAWKSSTAPITQFLISGILPN